ncbi:MAG TPA: class I poly(R)-hydroxyalkanoic acid synthase, partial [Microvirga sp.]|nr:class I poly(R)-hydroxyalkanoic acid synthase [Microvirga sp.]
MEKAHHDEATKLPVPDFEALSRNMARFVEEAGKATAAYLNPAEERRGNSGFAEEVGDIVKTLGQVAEEVMRDPQKAVEAQGRLATDFLSLWVGTLRRIQGEEAQPVA